MMTFMWFSDVYLMGMKGKRLIKWCLNEAPYSFDDACCDLKPFKFVFDVR